MKKISIPILSVVATAAILATACTAPRVIHDAGPSPSFSNEALHSCDDGTLLPGEASAKPCPSGSAVAKYEKQRALAVERELELNAKAGLPGGVDRGLAEAAVKDRVPLVFEVAQGSDPCGQVLRLPDRSLWSLATGGALTRNTNLETTLARYKGALPAIACQPGAQTQIPVGLDSVAADAAGRAGQPYRWSDVCGRTYVRVPGSAAKWVLPASPPVRGKVLSAEGLGWGCNSGVERPTTPKGN